jgi:predicted enzyme related to lactoylglutathione lyase
MTVYRAEVGLVSRTDELVAFYRDVFELTVLEPRHLPTGVVHRLGHSDAILKVMVPAAPPAGPAPALPQFWVASGLRFFTFWVDDLDGVIERCSSRGGTLALGPIDLRPGVRTVLVHDPDGNVIEVMQDDNE